MPSRISPRAAVALLHDALAAGATWVAAYALRFNFDIPPIFAREMLLTLVWVMPLQATVFYFHGLYRGLWRYASMHDLKKITLGGITAGAAVPVLLYAASPGFVVPRSVLLLQPILLISIMCGSRAAYRAWKEHRLYGHNRSQGQPVLVLGAGEAAASLVSELARSPDWKVVGLLDDNASKRGHLLHGVRVLGSLEDLPRLAADLAVRHAIVALPAASHAVRSRAVQICADAGVDALTVPSFDDLMSGKMSISQMRGVKVEDLLGRESVILDTHGLRDLIGGKVVMVSGAGGSIGSELCRQIAAFDPGLLILFELNEFALYRMEQECTDRFPGTALLCLVGDVKNRERVEQVLTRHRPAVIFHAAAYKHVPLMEENNSWEAVQNNVLGTYVLARAATELGVGRFVLVSTDKAVNPANVMGATKRLAEMVCQALQGTTGTRFAMVRFGNVLASAGSVIPRFHEQISRGGPVTVTHPDIMRYFMSIPEAARLVLQAGCMANGGEIFVLDMGEPIRIVDLARDMIRLSGFTESEIRITYTGLRPGEKLFEELLADDEHSLPTPHPKLRVARARAVDARWLDGLLTWLYQGQGADDAEVRRDLKLWVPEYGIQTRPRLTVIRGSASA